MRIFTNKRKNLLNFLGAGAFLSGCHSIGPGNMMRDHIDYNHSVQKGLQKELLLNIVLLRYGDVPLFIKTQQIIANYSFQKDIEGVIAGTPWGGTSPSTNGLGLRGTLSFLDNPTVTYQPLDGNEVASLILAPIPLYIIFPLIQSGIPIDMILNLTAISIGDNKNIRNPVSSGKYGLEHFKNFSKLMKCLAKLQTLNGLSIQNISGKEETKFSPAVAEQTFIYLEDTKEPEIEKIQNEVRKLLDLPPNTRKIEFIFRQKTKKSKNQVIIETRSVFSILKKIAATIDVPKKSIQSGLTSETIPENPDKNKPIIQVHCSTTAPSDAFTSTHYGGYDYWISKKDLQSKTAFTLLELFHEFAINRTKQNAIVTIPVRGGP